MELNLKDKRVLVTGGSRGIGKSIALLLAQEGCKVSICARNENNIDKALSEIKQYDPNAIGFKCDVLKKDEIDNVIEKLVDLGGIQILINNVGGGGRWGNYDILQTSEDVWDDVAEKNVDAARRFTLGFLPGMINQKWGRVITISSISGLQCHERPWFGIAKQSEIYLMKSLARRKEFARVGITFNSVAPGSIMVDGTGWKDEQVNHPERFRKTVEEFPLGRLGTPEEVAHLVVFMSSEKASLMNGSCVIVDGGESFII